MQKNLLLPLLILAIAGLSIFFLVKSKPTQLPATNEDTTVIPNVSKDIIWNAYTLNGEVYIYPSDWLFEEVKDPKTQKVIGFKTTNPISSNPFDKVEVGGACPEITIPEIHSSCAKNVWLHTQSENQDVLDVFKDMTTFANDNK